jgi:hypothetical protein
LKRRCVSDHERSIAFSEASRNQTSHLASDLPIVVVDRQGPDVSVAAEDILVGEVDHGCNRRLAEPVWASLIWIWSS